MGASMTERPFPAYQGDDPYIFVSYSHNDAESVYRELAWLHDQGINVWYDEGISPGSRWSDALAQALDAAAHVVFFVTPQSVTSQTCLDEVGFALEREKPLLAVHVEPTELPPGLVLRLGSRQAIMKYELADNVYKQKLSDVLGVYAKADAQTEPLSHLSEQAKAIERMCSSMAIVPMVNRSDDPELDALSEAIAEDVTDVLAAVWTGQRLIGGRETRHFKDAGASGKEIADELAVGMVLEGNMRQIGTKVRLTVELVNAEGERVWSHRFDEPKESIFDREDQMVDVIVWGLNQGQRIYLEKRAGETPTAQLGPWGLYYNAFHRFDVTDADARRECRELLDRAIALDPFQPFFKGMQALTLADTVVQGFSTDREADTRRALELAEEAAKSGIGVAIMTAGMVFGNLGDHGRSLALARRYYEMVPRFVPSKRMYAARLLYAGRAKEALQLFAEAELSELPGQTFQQLYLVAQAHAVVGNLDEAVATARDAVDQVPEQRHISLSVYANVLARADRFEEAAAMIDKVREIVPRFTIRKVINGYRRVFATEEAREAVTAGLQKLIDLGYD